MTGSYTVCAAGPAEEDLDGPRRALHELEVSVAGELDLGDFLQTAQTRAGFQQIQAVIRVRAEADEAALADLCRITTHASPVFDTVSRGVPVTASVERLPDGGAR